MFGRVVGRSNNLFFFLLVFLIPSTAFSNQKTIDKSSWRFGVGVSAEYIRADTKLEMKAGNSSINSVNTISVGLASNQHQVAKRASFSPSFEFGRFLFDNYYLGIFLSWRAPNMKSKATYDFKSLPYRFSNEFKINSYTNIFIKAGCRITKKAMFYGLVGPTFLKWSHTTDYVQLNRKNCPLQILNTYPKKISSIGLGIGAGIEYKVAKTFLLSADFSCSFYRSIKDSFWISYKENIYGVTAFRSGTIIKSLQPYHSAVALRLSYFL